MLLPQSAEVWECGLAKSEVGPFPEDMTGISLCLSITLQPLRGPWVQ